MTIHLVGFAEIGAYLRETREQAGLSTKQAAFVLRLRPVYMDWIEAGQIEKLPAPAYARAYIAKYAEYLELDVRLITQAFDDATRQRATVLSMPEPTRSDARPGLGIIAASLGLLLLGAGLWQMGVPLWQRLSADSDEAGGGADTPALAVAAPARLSGAWALPLHARACWHIMPRASAQQAPVCYWRALPNWLGMVPRMRYSTELTFPTYTTTTFAP